MFLDWNRLNLDPSEIQSLSVDREMWPLNLEMLSQWVKKKFLLVRKKIAKGDFALPCFNLTRLGT